MKNIIVQATVLEEIEKLRALMNESGIKRGLLHPTTIQLSQQLDLLLNQFMVEGIENKMCCI